MEGLLSLQYTGHTCNDSIKEHSNFAAQYRETLAPSPQFTKDNSVLYNNRGIRPNFTSVRKSRGVEDTSIMSSQYKFGAHPSPARTGGYHITLSGGVQLPPSPPASQGRASPHQLIGDSDEDTGDQLRFADVSI